MKVKTAEFVLGAASTKQLPGDGLPEIAFAGRSNVGKSSLMNKLLGRKNLARTSGKPGKTRELNIYSINEKLLFVDLPGYGFAKVPKAMKEKWGKLVESYVEGREELAGVVHLVDARHVPTAQDVQMQEWLRHLGVRTLIAATKADKIPKGKRDATLRMIRNTLEVPDETPVEFFSAMTGEGLRPVWSWVEQTAGLK
jgi:GTP-binding protein